jgi:hypothetical protein
MSMSLSLLSQKLRSKLLSSKYPLANGPASQSTQQLLPRQQLFPTESQLQSHSSQQDQQPQPVCTWSAHVPQSGRSTSPFPRYYHALSATATAAGELFLFGGYMHTTSSDDLYVISTRDFSTTLLQTSGEVPTPRGALDAALTSTDLLIWGGKKDYGYADVLDRPFDDSLRLLNLGTSCLLMSRLTPADQSVLCSSISQVDPHRGQWPRTVRSLLSYRDDGRFQALCFWWSDRQEFS